MRAELLRFVDVTRDIALADKGRAATNVWLRLKGLLGTESLADGEGLLIRPCQSIHTFFMAYPIDVLFVDRYSRIVHLCRAMAPYRVSRYVWRAKFVIELPAGTIDRTGTQVGDLLTIEASGASPH